MSNAKGWNAPKYNQLLKALGKKTLPVKKEAVAVAKK
jgi:hypothetical protein